jgi:hypothetical protein
VDQEETLWQAGRDIQAEGIVRMEQSGSHDQQQVDDSPAAQMVAQAVPEGFAIEALEQDRFVK